MRRQRFKIRGSARQRQFANHFRHRIAKQIIFPLITIPPAVAVECCRRQAVVYHTRAVDPPAAGIDRARLELPAQRYEN